MFSSPARSVLPAPSGLYLEYTDIIPNYSVIVNYSTELFLTLYGYLLYTFRMATEKKPKKPGRIPGPPTVKATVLLEEDLLEWGKQQPGGLSELVRRLLREERERTDKE